MFFGGSKSGGAVDVRRDVAAAAAAGSKVIFAKRVRYQRVERKPVAFHFLFSEIIL